MRELSNDEIGSVFGGQIEQVGQCHKPSLGSEVGHILYAIGSYFAGVLGY
jgi:hypothetical protein